MLEQNNIINFKKERLKHRIKCTMCSIKQVFINFLEGDFSSQNRGYENHRHGNNLRRRKIKNI